MVMAHPEHLRTQGTAWGQERGTELQCFLPKEGLSCQEGLVGCLEKPLLSVGLEITPINHHFHLAVRVQLPVGPAGPEEWCGQQKPSVQAGDHGLENVQNPAGSPSTGWQDRAGRCHHIGEVSAALP